MSRVIQSEVQPRTAGPRMRGLLIVACLAVVVQGLFFFRNEHYREVAPFLAAEIAAIGPLLFFAARSLSTKWVALYLSQIGLAYGGVMFAVDDRSWRVNIMGSDADLLSSLAVAAAGVGACGLGTLWRTTKKSRLPHGYKTISLGPLWGSWRWWLASYVATIWIDHFWAYFSAIGFIGHLIRGWPLVAILALDVMARTKQAPAGMTRLIWGGLVPLRMLLGLGTGFGAIVVYEGLILLFYLTMRGVIRIRVWGIALACLATVLSFWVRTIVREEIWTSADSPATRAGVAVAALTSLGDRLSASNVKQVLDEFASYRVGHAVLAAHTLVVSETPDRVPYLKGESFYQFLWLFVPRALYPDKPSEIWGQKYGHRYGLLDAQDYSTSFNLAQLTEFYANGGIWLVLAMMGGVGWVIHRVAGWTERLDNHSADILWIVLPIAFGMLFQAFSNLSIAVNGAVYYAVVLIAPTLLHLNAPRHGRRQQSTAPR